MIIVMVIADGWDSFEDVMMVVTGETQDIVYGKLAANGVVQDSDGDWVYIQDTSNPEHTMLVNLQEFTES